MNGFYMELGIVKINTKCKAIVSQNLIMNITLRVLSFSWHDRYGLNNV